MLDSILCCHDLVKSDFEKAIDCYLWDSSGMSYTDFESGTWCTALGHNHPRINEVISGQLKLVSHLNHRYSNASADIASNKLTTILGIPNSKATFLCSGSEAVAWGLKILRTISPLKKVLTLKDSYLAAYGEASEQKDEFWDVFDCEECFRCEPNKNCGTACKNFSNIQFKNISGFVFEPGSMSGLVKFPPSKLIHALTAEIKNRNGYLMVNEVTTGIGRTGKWFGFHHYGIKPDIVSIGKGLGNGYPVSAVAVGQSVAEQLHQKGFMHAQSHTNDPMGCEIAAAVIDTLSEEGLIMACQESGDYMLSKLEKLKEKHTCIKDVRGRGLLTALELEDRFYGKPILDIFQGMLTKGMLIGFFPTRGVLRFFPPFTIKNTDIDQLISALDESLSTTYELTN